MTPTDIPGSFTAKMHKQCFEKASCNPRLWKHLLCEHFSFLPLDLVLAAKSVGDIKAGKMLNVLQLCINMQDGTSPLLLDGGQFVPVFKIELQGKMTEKPL